MLNVFCRYFVPGDYKKQLLKYIEADQLPISLGGTLPEKTGDSKYKDWASLPKPSLSYTHYLL